MRNCIKIGHATQFAYETVKAYNNVKEKVQSVDWGVIGRVAIGVGVVVAAVAVVYFVPYLAPMLIKAGVPALAAFIFYLNL